MELRKLEQKEHNSTRPLWEAVFEEDTKTFLDYYYFLKTRDNEIYVVEEDGAFRSMLHLNPYEMNIGDGSFESHYIIAVATEERYRRRGYMGMLLREAMEVMYHRKEPFTFLMPAAESIYTPYDFRFIYNQRQGEITGRKADAPVEIRDASFFDAADMAAFFQTYIAPQYEVYAVRTEEYYQTMILEQQSENGGVKLLMDQGQIVGMFAYASEGAYEIREPLYQETYKEQFYDAVLKMTQNTSINVKVLAAGDDMAETEEKPVIMARILHLESLLQMLRVKEGETLDCSFAVLDSILLKNNKIFRLNSDLESRKLSVKETEDSDGVLTIAALTSLLFGYKTAEEVAGEPDVILSGRLLEELQKIEPLDRVFLNEIV